MKGFRALPSLFQSYCQQLGALEWRYSLLRLVGSRREELRKWIRKQLARRSWWSLLRLDRSGSSWAKKIHRSLFIRWADNSSPDNSSRTIRRGLFVAWTIRRRTIRRNCVSQSHCLQLLIKLWTPVITRVRKRERERDQHVDVHKTQVFDQVFWNGMIYDLLRIGNRNLERW